MGYGEFSQRGQGIHLRQYARAFIFEDERRSRVVFVSADAGMMGHAVKRDVLNLLKARYGDAYRFENVVLSGSHSHSVPSGFLMSYLYDIASLGFVPQNFDALVEGITLAIVRAHESMREGRLYLSETTVHEANINRSPSAYENNPRWERDQYLSMVARCMASSAALPTRKVNHLLIDETARTRKTENGGETLPLHLSCVCVYVCVYAFLCLSLP